MIRKIWQKIIGKIFYILEKYMYLHIMVPDYYSPIPYTKHLGKEDFERKFSCVGIYWNEKQQTDFLELKIVKYSNEFIPYSNSGLSLFDAFTAYAMVREQKPKKIVEIGFGESTKILLKALKENLKEGYEYDFHSIDPYPGDSKSFAEEKKFHLIPKEVQNVSVDFFQDCDLLFIDSSHVSKFGSDVNYEILEILPMMKVGSLIHWHDIVFPREYPEVWIKKSNYFWNESYILQAFLSFNSAFQIQWASKFMQINHEEKIKKALSSFQSNHNLTSLWVKKIQ